MRRRSHHVRVWAGQFESQSRRSEFLPNSNVILPPSFDPQKDRLAEPWTVNIDSVKERVCPAFDILAAEQRFLFTQKNCGTQLADVVSTAVTPPTPHVIGRIDSLFSAAGDSTVKR
jgi:hypothetical protein